MKDLSVIECYMLWGFWQESLADWLIVTLTVWTAGLHISLAPKFIFASCCYSHVATRRQFMCMHACSLVLCMHVWSVTPRRKHQGREKMFTKHYLIKKKCLSLLWPHARQIKLKGNKNFSLAPNFRVNQCYKKDMMIFKLSSDSSVLKWKSGKYIEEILKNPSAVPGSFA